MGKSKVHSYWNIRFCLSISFFQSFLCILSLLPFIYHNKHLESEAEIKLNKNLKSSDVAHRMFTYEDDCSNGDAHSDGGFVFTVVFGMKPEVEAWEPERVDGSEWVMLSYS